MRHALAWWVWVVVAALLGLAALVRPLSGNPHLAGESSYAALIRILGAAGAGGDAVSLHAPYTAMEALVGRLVQGPSGAALARLLPVVGGAALLGAVWAVMAALNRPFVERTLAVFLLAMDPAFVLGVGSFELRLAAVALMASAVWAALRGRALLAVLVATLLPLWGVEALAGGVLALAVVFALRRRPVWILGAAAAGIAVAAAVGAWAQPTVWASPETFLIELGGETGVSVFRLVLFLVGLALAWQPRRPLLYVAMAACLAAAVVLPLFRLLVMPLIAVFSAHTLFWMMRRPWQVKWLRPWTLLVVACALLLSMLSGVLQLLGSPPAPALVEAMGALHNSLPGERVLTAPRNAAFVEFFSPRAATRHEPPRPTDVPAAVEEALYEARTINERTTRVLAAAKVGYVLVTPDMRQGGVWAADDEGLLFLMANSERFINLYRQDGIEVWQYLGAR